MTGTCESAPAQCLHLHLRDTCGAKFLVEVFHYHLEGHHLLGIKRPSVHLSRTSRRSWRCQVPAHFDGNTFVLEAPAAQAANHPQGPQ